MKQLITFGFFFFYSTVLWASADIIEAFEFKGNEKTSDETLIRISELEVGQEFTNSQLREAQNLIASSGIFEEVKVLNRRGSDDQHRVITIDVKEKMTWFLLPAFSYSQTGVSLGGVFGETNLGGRMKKLGILGDWGPDLRRLAGGYRDPRVFGSLMTLKLDGIYRRDNMANYVDRRETRKVRVREWGGTVLPGVRWTENFSTYLGIYYRRVNEGSKSSNPLLDVQAIEDYGNDIAVVVEFEFQKMKNYDGLLEGTEIKFSTQFSDDRYFSDYDYNKQLLYLTEGFTFMRHRASFLTKASVQMGKTLPYYIELMAGGDNLRGYLYRQFRGDTKYAFTQELMMPVYDFNRFILRMLVFWDNTIIYFKDVKDAEGQAFDRSKWHNGLGTGVRFYLKGISIPIVGLDFARGLEDASFAFYLTVGAVF